MLRAITRIIKSIHGNTDDRFSKESKYRFSHIHIQAIETYQEKKTEKECEEIQSFDECAEMDETDELDQQIT